MIKKTTLILFLLLAFCLGGIAQTNVIVTGMVTVGGVSPAQNYAVTITLATGGGVITSNVFSNLNGIYADTIQVNTTQGAVDASLLDCHGNTQTGRGFFSPMSNLVIIDLESCPTVPLCQSAFTWIVGIQPLAYAFTDQSIGNITSWQWDFGDGVSSTIQNPNHVYGQAGTYVVCLIAADATTGCVDTSCQTLIVSGTGGGQCNADFTAAPTGMGLSYSFVDRSSPANSITSWEWDFGDGNTSTTQNPTHTYAMTGTYNVCLIITAPTLLGVCMDTTCFPVLVSNSTGGCNANFTFSQTPTGVFAFTDLSSPVAGNSTWSWDFGDGTTSNQQNPTHVFTNPGTYNVCLIFTTPTTGSICSDTSCSVITIMGGGQCQASFTINSNGGATVSFNNQSSFGSYSWDFGDGNTSAGVAPTHTYTASGIYTVCLYVTCANGNIDTMCSSVTVQVGPNANNISGVVSKTAATVAVRATVYLITLDTQLGILTAIDTTVTGPQGFYTFNNLTGGDYRVKAALETADPDYANFLPTYHTSSLFWNTATVVTVNNGQTVSANIAMTPGMNPGGPGFIGGLISQGANKRDPGDPLEGISILLLDDQDNPITHTVTDANGEYSLSNLAYGTYKVYVEVIGKDGSFQLVTLGPGSSSVSGIDFLVNSTYVAVGIQETTFGKLLNVYPNPTSGNVNVDLSIDKPTGLILSVTDLMGRTVSKAIHTLPAGEQTLKIDMAHLPIGLYTLNLISDKQVISTKVNRQ